MLLECRYQYALELFDIGDYQGAEERFASVGDYKESQALLLETRYLLASQYFSARNYAAAESMFGQLSGYKDSDTLLSESRRLKSMVVSADGYSLSVGNRVYAKETNFLGFSLNLYSGYIVSIDSANSVNVLWDTHLMNRAWAFEEYPMNRRDTLPANRLYAKVPSGMTIF
jgi:tetratricopeptide (TPR) repeat protein